MFWIFLITFLAVMAYTNEGRQILKQLLSYTNQGLKQLKGGVKKDPVYQLEQGLNKLGDKKKDLISNLSDKQSKAEQADKKIHEVERKIRKRNNNAKEFKERGLKEEAKAELSVVADLQSQLTDLQSLKETLDSSKEKYDQTIKNIDRTIDSGNVKLESLKIRQDITGGEGDIIDTELSEGVQKLIEDANQQLRKKELENGNKRKYYRLTEKQTSNNNEVVEEMYQQI